ncbi:hypothetical protein INR49_013440, partial [Caranx melampygus]
MLFFFLTAEQNSQQVEADSEDVPLATQSPEDNSTDAVPSSQPVTEPAPPQTDSSEKAEEPVNSGVSKQPSAESDPSLPPTPEKPTPSPSSQSSVTSGPRHHETGALIVTKTAYIIPKKPSGPQPPSVSASTSCQKSSAAPTLLNEARNLLVPPAPSAPSSRPSQPNTQVRQSIQRSLTSILFKRVSDCEDLEMSESDAAKLVANIEMEMFNIFRNTDSKYMNKYRTIMFNIKDPRNMGLLYRVVRGDISPFRLVRMSQKDMQATKAPESSPKETPEVKEAAAKPASLLPKPEAVKVDLSSLNPARPDRKCNKKPDGTVTSQEQKRSLPTPALKTRTPSSQGSAIPDILTCMLKDTTSEHKTHLFDLKCKICTGQIPPMEEDEPAKKKPKVSETRDKHKPLWKKSGGDDSPLHAPPDSPDMDSPESPLLDPSSRLIIDSPALTIVESPASPTMDSPASPTSESPASPAIESPASPTPDTPKATIPNRAYTPVVIPVVSTVNITRRDPRTAANRNVISESPPDGESAQFLAKQEILWKGFLNMLTVAKFVTKGYLVSGSAENLRAELCVIRFQPATEEEEVAYVSLFSYFSSRGRFGVVANSSRSIKDVYLVPLSAKESIPSILQPFEGPGLEKNRPNLLLGLAIIQKTKRPGSLPQEIEEKRPKVHMPKDPMWIPKPPVLYGSDKLEIFQPYDPETPASTTPPDSPSCPGSPSDSSSSGSVTVPSLLTSTRGTPVSISAGVAITESTSNSISDKNSTTASSNKTPLQTILKTLFGDKKDSSDVSSATTLNTKKNPVFSQVSAAMADPIVQQYGQKSKVKEIEEENDFDRPYDPEDEYDPAIGFGRIASQNIEKNERDDPALSGIVDDDVAYDPEDETIFEEMQSDTVVPKALVPTQTSDSPTCPTLPQVITTTATPLQTPAPAAVMATLPTGAVVVSAATLTEQQRMLEELNKQIEEQKRQLKEQEEALRQQREAVAAREQTQIHTTVESEGSHQRSEVIVKGTIEVPQEDHRGVHPRIPGDVEKGIDKGEVKGIGQNTELEASLNAVVSGDQVIEMSGDQALKEEVLILLVQDLTGKDQGIKMSGDKALKEEVLECLVQGLTGEDQEIKMSGVQGLKGEGLIEEDQKVQNSVDQNLKGEVPLWTVNGLTGEDLEVQISRGKMLRAQGLTQESQVAQALGNLGLHGDVQIWRAQDLSGEDQVIQTSESKKVQMQMVEGMTEEMTGEGGTLEGQSLSKKTQGQILGVDPGLMEIPEAEYTHTQHFIQAHGEAHAGPTDGPHARAPPATMIVEEVAGSTAMSPFMTTQAIDLSTSTEEHCVLMPGEKTPASSYGEVPGSVLARMTGENSPREPPACSRTSPLRRSRSSARVCLEKRFNTMSADTETPRNKDVQSAVLSNFLTILQQSAEAHGAVVHPQMQKWMKTDRPNPIEVTNVFGYIPHIVEPNQLQGFSFNVCPERVINKTHHTSSSNPTQEKLVSIRSNNDEVTPTASRKHGGACIPKPTKAAKVSSESAGGSVSSTKKRAQPCISHGQRRERHNIKERERRRRIRLYCDELNVLVPFCESDTDKVTTLQWTTAFLKYINKTYGDTFRKEFQTAFNNDKGQKSSPSLDKNP